MEKLLRTDINKKIANFLGEFSNICGKKRSPILDDLKINNDQHIILKAESFQKLLIKLNLSFENVIYNKIDYHCLQEKILNDKDLLPRKYSRFAFSKNRTINNVFDYIEKKYGKVFLDSLLRRFQTNSKMFKNPNEKVNNFFITDLLDELKSKGFPDDEFIRIGQNTYNYQANSKIGKELKELNHPKKIYQYTLDELSSKFDENWDYKIKKISLKGCNLEVTPRKNVMEMLEKKTLGSKQVSLMMLGVHQSFKRFYNDKMSLVLQTASIHNDEPCEKIHIAF